MAGRRGSAIDRRKKPPSVDGYVSLGRRISLQICALFNVCVIRTIRIVSQLYFAVNT